MRKNINIYCAKIIDVTLLQAFFIYFYFVPETLNLFCI